MTHIDVLTDSLNLGSTTLKNRAAVAPMTRISATPEGLATDQMASYYASFARGGFGLIITEGVYTDELFSQGYFDQPGLANDAQAQSWKKVVGAVHHAGAKIIAQLMHAGGISQGNRFAAQTLAPSSVQPKGEQLSFYKGEGPYPTPGEATKEDLQNVIKGFVDSAVRAKTIGFDGVEIHGANGYLLDQFLTDYSNQRTDEYGGSTVNRVRFLMEVSHAVRQAVGQDFTVGIRISQGKVNDFVHKWAGKEEDAKIIFGRLGQAGLNYIHVTEYQAWQPAFPEHEGDSSGKSLAALAKKYAELPVFANGHLEEPSMANEMLANGDADLVTIGKGALANHDWVNKIKNGVPQTPFDPEQILKPDAKIKEFEIMDTDLN
ncbi:NADH:flavin oxidoreductase [Paenibacillus pasadenensis]|uniref:NADH:flavin oxidoreductase n=1 Tax=Paenibacillus pasadenensis TaxID=217090 RepID=UPI00203CE136|nr:NADH:flavin oxidoreductase [Paenibacillus pasadenensis]MCM3746262.1 NADH:flavin oxidoreductase [Paenibacillus pasadenensis]